MDYFSYLCCGSKSKEISNFEEKFSSEQKDDKQSHKANKHANESKSKLCSRGASIVKNKPSGTLSHGRNAIVVVVDPRLMQ